MVEWAQVTDWLHTFEGVRLGLVKSSPGARVDEDLPRAMD